MPHGYSYHWNPGLVWLHVISDLLMTKMNGIELLRNLKQIDPKVPVIIITGYGTLDDAIEAIKLGAEDFIKKPFDISEVIATIDKTFKKQEEEEDQRAIIKHIAQYERNADALEQSCAFARIEIEDD